MNSWSCYCRSCGNQRNCSVFTKCDHLLFHLSRWITLILKYFASSISQAQAKLTSTAEATKGLRLKTSVRYPRQEYMTTNCLPQPLLQFKLEHLWRMSISAQSQLILHHLYNDDSLRLWIPSAIFVDMESKINAFATSCYRIMLDIKQKRLSSTPL